jgi:hypothetical protein
VIFLDAGCLSCEQIQSVEKLATTSPLAGKNASGAWAFESRLACVISTPATATSARRCCSYRHQYMLANSMCVSQIRPPYSMWCSNGQQQKLTITLDRGPEPRYIRWKGSIGTQERRSIYTLDHMVSRRCAAYRLRLPRPVYQFIMSPE